MPRYMSGIEIVWFYLFRIYPYSGGLQYPKCADDALQTIVGIFSSDTDADDSLENVLLGFFSHGFAALGGSFLHVSE